MTPPPVAKLAFITEPEPGVCLLNLQIDVTEPRVIEATAAGATYERVRLTDAQLGEMLVFVSKWARGRVK